MQGGTEAPPDSRIILIADDALMAEIQREGGFNADRMQLIPTAAEVMAIAVPGVEVPYFPEMSPDACHQLRVFAAAVSRQIRFYRLSSDSLDRFGAREIRSTAIL